MSENKKITSSYHNGGNFNFNYSFSAGVAKQPLKPALKDLLVLDDVTFSPVSNDAALVVNSRTDKMVVINSTMANLVQNCDAFRTLEQHLQHIKKLFKLTDPVVNELKKAISTMNSQGLMLSAETFKTKLLVDPVAVKTKLDKQWVLGVGSCDRPELVKRMLASALPYLQDYSPKPKFIFVDDSRDKQNRQENHLIATSFCETLSIELHYWDRTKRADFAEKLAKENPEYGQSINWLLNPERHGDDAASYGLGKNFIQLYALQKPLIMLDDDCIISPIARTDNKQNVRLCAEENKLLPFTDMNALLKTTKQLEINPFKAHLDQLNIGIIESVSIFEKVLDDADIWQELERDNIFKFTNKNYVGMTTNCIAGAQNSRHMDMLYIHSKDASSHENFLKSVISEGEIKQISWRGSLSNNINRNLPFICTTMSGLAATDLPTPTIPVGRNEDIFLGELKIYLDPDIQTHQFNWALSHLPEPERKWNPQLAQTSVPVGASFVLRKILQNSAENCPYDNQVERLHYFTHQLESVVNSSEANLKKYVTDVAVDYLTNEIFRLENIANDVKNHALYLKGVRQLMGNRQQELMQILNSGSAVIIAEFLQLATPMSNAFRQWPRIVTLTQQHF